MRISVSKKAAVRSAAVLVTIGMAIFLLAFFQNVQGVPELDVIDGDGIYSRDSANGIEIRTTPHTTHASWTTPRQYVTEFINDGGSDQQGNAAITSAYRPEMFKLELQKEQIVQYPIVNASNHTIGFNNVTENYWDEITDTLSFGRENGLFAGSHSITLPANDSVVVRWTVVLNQSEEIDSQGRKKFNVCLYKGSLASPTYELCIDPWVDGRNCTAYFDFNSSTTPNATHSINNPDCTLGNASITATTGEAGANETGRAESYGESYFFDDDDDGIVSFENITITGAAASTVMAWININSTDGDDDTVIVMWGTYNAGEFRMMGTRGSTPEPFFFAAAGPCDSNVALQLNKWYHVAYTADTAGSRKIYVNGTLAVTCGATTMETKQSPVYIGNNSLTGGTGDYDVFSGNIDEVFISPDLFDDDEVLAHYINGSRSFITTSDVEAPSPSDALNVTPLIFNSAEQSNFSTNWTDNTAVSVVRILLNVSNSLTGYTPSNSTSTRWNLTVAGIEAGTHYWQSNATDAAGNLNTTEWFQFIILVADSCTAPAINQDWQVNSSHLCNLTNQSIELGTGKLLFTDDGRIEFDGGNFSGAGFQRNDTTGTDTIIRFKNMNILRID